MDRLTTITAEADNALDLCTNLLFDSKHLLSHHKDPAAKLRDMILLGEGVASLLLVHLSNWRAALASNIPVDQSDGDSIVWK